MDLKLKQRMIGAVIIIALAIIVLPIVLGGDQQERLEMTRHMPPPPEVSVERFDPHDLRAEMKRIEEASSESIPGRTTAPGDESEASSNPEALALDSDGLPIAWSLQVASFKSPENAVKLRDELRDKGYQSYRLDATTEEGTVSRVLVGPSLQRARLEEIRKSVKREFGLTGQIIRYDTVDDRNMVGG